MLAISGAFFHHVSSFFVDYYREWFLALIVLIYFGTLFWTRPRRAPAPPTSPAPREGTDLRS